MSFHLPKGGMAFLTGHSGAGKTTILDLISLHTRPSTGKIRINNQLTHQIGARGIPQLRRQMGIISQTPDLLFDRSVFHNVGLPLQILGFSDHDIKRRTRAALDKVGLLRVEKLNPKMLSAGEQQRVGIARAVVHKPMLLLADEPTGNLDPTLSLELMKLFCDFNQVGVSVLIATHDIALITQMTYPILTLKQGQLINNSL